MENKMVIMEFSKNSREKVVGEFTSYNDYDLFNVRVLERDKRNNEQWVYTKNGLTIRVSLIPQLKELVDMAYKELQKVTSLAA